MLPFKLWNLPGVKRGFDQLWHAESDLASAELGYLEDVDCKVVIAPGNASTVISFEVCGCYGDVGWKGDSSPF